jgi:hypothetical protein
MGWENTFASIIKNATINSSATPINAHQKRETKMMPVSMKAVAMRHIASPKEQT